MDRNELKGKQTPGEVSVSKFFLSRTDRVILHTGEESKVCKYLTEICGGYADAERHANAALYAEAHNVANETDMWPKDLLERVKELEHLLSSVYGAWPLHGIAPEFEERIKTILNKRP